ncbi:HtrA protease/chaperone protein [Rhodovastum atsumiense]|uniref:Probable periplasmic serine endoprotease DegP-like n=1 Tax=Rhodovastum atsumiense TaxID=504468 RepID=A0A5M6IZ32_9PROT|nr:trypsin-like peptidase domain-containing protein [Rhodovastum atsumiense]KAA5613606.1 PDZ domain-containing protein [Rhodovastum atsumiense]CAH2599508.1 HtrA protease/chaperone protein [Rhodovastum atsumiense]
MSGDLAKADASTTPAKDMAGTGRRGAPWRSFGMALLFLLSPAAFAAPGDPGNRPPDLPDIIAPLLPAVVSISVLKQPASPGGHVAQGAEAMARPVREFGSGFIIDPAGHVVTNRHVVAGAYKVTVTLIDATPLDATVLATSERPDLALLKIEAGRELGFVRFGDSDAIRTGETVVAIGNPLDLSDTVTVGVVSAVNRDVNKTMIDDFIQTDAAINHGNSGGPLFNLRGEVIGVNWALVSPPSVGASIGLGLAIPANDAAFVIDQMRRFGRWQVGWVGVRVQQLTPPLAAALGLGGTEGGIVTSVWPGGPAARAGVQEGDVILQFGPRPSRDVRALLRAISRTAPGSSATVRLWRAGQVRSFDIAVASWPAEVPFDPAGPPAGVDRGPRMHASDLGLRFAVRDPAAVAAGPPTMAGKGVLVTAVAANSVAADAGIAAGDVILRVGDQPVTTPDEVRARLDGLRGAGRREALLLVRSGDRPQWVVVPIEHP